MTTYKVGDYVQTIPCGICLVKARKRDLETQNIVCYVVITKAGSKFYMPIKLIKDLATKKQIAHYGNA